jgi:hypothetical protein
VRYGRRRDPSAFSPRGSAEATAWSSKKLSCVKELAGFDLDLAGAQYMYV